MKPNERKYTVTVGESRKSECWKQKTTSWAKFVERCKDTKRTPETVEQYKAMNKDEKTAIKDVGGFVSGTLDGTRRKKEAVKSRSMIALDLDTVATSAEELWQSVSDKLDFALLVHSTHSHTAQKPRLRLIIPTCRDMAPDEYEPIARRIASTIGIEQSDSTTYDIGRLMFWPSTPFDGEFYFNTKDGELCDPDTILATYDDWHNAESWPVAQAEASKAKHERKNLEDPRQKDSGPAKIIGAFCRAYDIEDAIETFLADIYEPGAKGRYTYKKGSTANGLVCYDHLWAYSNHSTDPARGKCCNAFDLVRIHKFGHLDKDKDESNENPAKSKSFKAMSELASKDERVKTELKKDIVGDFNGTDFDEAESAWIEQLELTGGKDNKLKQTTNNFRLILENDPELCGNFWLNELSLYVECRDLSWNKEQHQWSDFDDSQLRCYLETRYGLYSKERLNDAFNAVVMANRRHPVRKYLDSLQWDGTPRLDTVVIRLLGAQDTPLNRAMTRKHFTAAIARVMKPGCKYDTCLTLTGPEETGKSSLFRIMGGAWFDDSITTIEGKEGRESLRGKWIIELAELSSIKKSEIAAVKNFLSNQNDSYRAAYDRRVTPYPRQCVFCATTNETYFLKGDTGNRRFWIIEISPGLATGGTLCARLEQLAAERDQLWAEAMHYYRAGEMLYLDDSQSAELREAQEGFNADAEDPYREPLEQFLNTLLPADWQTYPIQRRYRYFNDPDELDAHGVEVRLYFMPREFLCEKIGLKLSDRDFSRHVERVNKLMRSFPEWTDVKTSNHAKNLYGKQRAWKRIFPPVDDDEI